MKKTLLFPARAKTVTAIDRNSKIFNQYSPITAAALVRKTGNPIQTLKRAASILITAAVAICLILGISMDSMAGGITSDDAFYNLSWTEVFRVPAGEGTAQSVVATDDYIIVIENMADDSTVKDVVTSYYRNDKDADGISVEQYSVALRVQNDHLERGNGLAYNPNTNLLYVAPSTCYDSENYGHILVLDPETLLLTETEYLTYSYGINGISYNKNDDTYVVQGNHDNQYGFAIYDANLDLVSDLGAPDIDPGYAPQDICVCGDYIISSPAMEQTDIPYLNIYSISGNRKVNTIQMNIPLDDLISAEPQSITELNAGQLLVMVNETNTAGESSVVFYETKLPYNFTISTTVSNGTISETASDALRGSDYTVKYEPNDGFALSSISIDGVSVNPDGHDNSYTFTNVDDNHSIIVTFADKSLVKQQDQARKEAYKSVNKLLGRTVKKHGAFKKVLIIIIILALVVAALILIKKFRNEPPRNGRKIGKGNRHRPFYKNSGMFGGFRSSNKRRYNREKNLKQSQGRSSRPDRSVPDLDADYDDDYYISDSDEVRIPKGMRDINSLNNSSHSDNSSSDSDYGRHSYDDEYSKSGSLRKSFVRDKLRHNKYDDLPDEEMTSTVRNDREDTLSDVRRYSNSNYARNDVPAGTGKSSGNDFDITSVEEGMQDLRKSQRNSSGTHEGTRLNVSVNGRRGYAEYNRAGANTESMERPNRKPDDTKVNSGSSQNGAGRAFDMEAVSLKKRDTRNMDHFYREEVKLKTGAMREDDGEPDIPLQPWPDELSGNQVGHWQDGVWVTTRVAGPND